jgi:hypothetical protein
MQLPSRVMVSGDFATNRPGGACQPDCFLRGIEIVNQLPIAAHMKLLLDAPESMSLLICCLGTRAEDSLETLIQAFTDFCRRSLISKQRIFGS